MVRDAGFLGGEIFAVWRGLRGIEPEARAVLRQEQALIGRRMGPFTLTVSILAAALLAWINWDRVPHPPVLLWLTLIAAPLVALLLVWWREGFTVPARLRPRVLRRIPVTALVEGLLWAAAPALFFDPADPERQMLLGAIIFSLTAASVVVLSGLLLTVWLYATPPILSLAFSFWQQDTPEMRLLAAVVVIYGGLLMTGAFLGYRRFVTRVEAQVAAREALETLEEALESVGEAFGLFDAAGQPIFLNRGYRALFKGKPDGLKPGEEVVQKIGGRWLRSAARRTASGKEVHLHADVTALKQTEDALREARDAAEQASHAKSQFLATMSHELRTPLNAIIGFAELLAARPDLPEAKRREYAETIRQAGRHLLALLNDILDLSRIEAGAYRLDRAVVPLRPLVDELLAMFAVQAREEQITLANEVPESLAAEADERALRQILINLVGNAVKFTPAGGRVTVSAARREDEVEIVVADTGEGIAPEDLERVLEPFVQGEDAMNRRHGGTGLGLPLVKRLVELHGGRLHLESARGRGTRASFTLPAAKS
ncbi:MAG: hypothetical protein KatS3mg119_1647 [Rhodothalassiaceae bacterium]|nr:MAG: hypothetical protein KatS3mg119_1647 [Rhodothalassiaceae bacterium]